MSLYDKASLVMIPSGYKDDKLYSIKPTSGDGDFTFSRDGSGASPATRVNSAGLIEKGRTNFLLNSIWDGVGTNTAPTSWVNGFTSGNYESAASSTNGNTAIRFYGTSARRYISQAPSFGGIMALSVYVESVTTADEIRYLLNQIGGTELFYLEDSSVVANTTSISAGKTYTLVFNTSGTTEIRIGGGVTGNRTYDFTLSVPQLEKGLVATSYIETTTAAASAGILGDMPRLDYSGGASCPSLLLEPSRTNIISQSEYFDGLPNKFEVVIDSNAVTSPEGLQNATKISANNVSGLHYVDNHSSVIASSYSVSIYAKAGETNKFLFLTNNRGSNVARGFDVSNGTTFANDLGYSEPTSYSIEAVGNDWYYCTMQFSKTSVGLTAMGVFLTDNSGASTFVGNGSDGMYFYGFQQEAGSYPTSYVPTYGSATARAKDVCDGAGNSSLFNDSEGVLFAEVSFARDKGQSSPFKLDRISLSDGTTNNRILISNTTTANEIQVFIRNSSSNIFNETITLTDITANNKIAVRYESGNYALYINGTEEATGASTNVPSGLNELMFDGPSGNYEFEGKVKQTLYFPTALTDAELESLTTI